jgi:hypothetical protein
MRYESVRVSQNRRKESVSIPRVMECTKSQMSGQIRNEIEDILEHLSQVHIGRPFDQTS